MRRFNSPRRRTIRRPHKGAPPPDTYRVNRRIRVPEVRVIAADGNQLGIMPTHEALRVAEQAGLDLVEVSPRAVPPVCRIMDYGKFKFEEAKQKRQAKKRATVIQLKEVKFRPKTDEHDYAFKLRHIRRFLEEGNKVRMLVQFRGREIVHPHTGRAVLEAVLKDIADIAHLEQMPMMEGRNMAMIVSPRPGVMKERVAAPPPPRRLDTTEPPPGAPAPSGQAATPPAAHAPEGPPASGK